MFEPRISDFEVMFFLNLVLGGFIEKPHAFIGGGENYSAAQQCHERKSATFRDENSWVVSKLNMISGEFMISMRNIVAGEGS